MGAPCAGGPRSAPRHTPARPGPPARADWRAPAAAAEAERAAAGTAAGGSGGGAAGAGAGPEGGGGGAWAAWGEGDVVRLCVGLLGGGGGEATPVRVEAAKCIAVLARRAARKQDATAAEEEGWRAACAAVVAALGPESAPPVRTYAAR